MFRLIFANTNTNIRHTLVPFVLQEGEKAEEEEEEEKDEEAMAMSSDFILKCKT